MLCIVGGLALGAAVVGEAEGPFEREIIAWVQESGDARWDSLAWVGSRIGDVWPGVILTALVFALICAVTGRGAMAMVFLAGACLRVVTTPLKLSFTSPRPPLELIRLSEGFGGFGYPSGHALGATLVFGSLLVFADHLAASRWMRWFMAVLAGVAILLVAWSRVRLGVHWPSDVVGGVLFGFGCVFVMKAVVLMLQDLGKV